MRRFWWIFLPCLPVAGMARGEPLPAEGEVAGKVRIDAAALGRELGQKWPADALAGLDLRWAVKLGAAGLIVEASRPGVVIEVGARPEAGGAWSWELRRGEIDLNEAWGLARRLLGELAGDWSAMGRIELRGAGRWSPEEGLNGSAGVRLRDGWATSVASKIEASGVEFDLTCPDLATGELAPGQTLRVARVTAAGAEAENFEVVFGLGADRVLAVAGGGVEMLGGRARVRPFRGPVEKLAEAGAAGLEVDGVQVAQAANLLPWLFKSAQGSLSGRVAVAWKDGEFSLREGGLDVVKSDAAEFRFAPGVVRMTDGMPDKFRFFPGVPGLGWIGVNNLAYEPLKNIENGREGLRIEEFTVKFWPDGPQTGRPLMIRIVGRPTEEALVKRVTLDVNFHGPLSEVIGFAMNREYGEVGTNVRIE